MIPRKPLVLAIHPTSRGFGYVVFEGPFAPYDWGTVGATGDKNAVCLRKIAMMLDRFCPETVVMEASAKKVQTVVTGSRASASRSAVWPSIAESMS